MAEGWLPLQFASAVLTQIKLFEHFLQMNHLEQSSMQFHSHIRNFLLILTETLSNSYGE